MLHSCIGRQVPARSRAAAGHSMASIAPAQKLTNAAMLTSAGIRCMSVRSFATSYQALVYDSHGPPQDVLRVLDHPVRDVGQRDVLLQILAVGGAPTRYQAPLYTCIIPTRTSCGCRLPSTPPTSIRSRASTLSSRRCQQLPAMRASVLCAEWAVRYEFVYTSEASDGPYSPCSRHRSPQSTSFPMSGRSAA